MRGPRSWILHSIPVGPCTKLGSTYRKNINNRKTTSLNENNNNTIIGNSSGNIAVNIDANIRPDIGNKV